MRLIDADEFFKDFTELEPYEHISHEYDIDAVEVKHGEWLKTDEFPHRVYCSVCFKTYVTNEEVIQGRSWDCPIYAYEAEYCPHCGAKMYRKEKNE